MNSGFQLLCQIPLWQITNVPNLASYNSHAYSKKWKRFWVNLKATGKLILLSPVYFYQPEVKHCWLCLSYVLPWFGGRFQSKPTISISIPESDPSHYVTSQIVIPFILLLCYFKYYVFTAAVHIFVFLSFSSDSYSGSFQCCSSVVTVIPVLSSFIQGCKQCCDIYSSSFQFFPVL